MSKAIQVRDVPDAVHRRLKARAAEEGMTLSELIRAELANAASRPTLAEMLERISAREPADPGERSSEAIAKGRIGR